MLFCLAVHWLDLKMWFFGDDFAWLGLRQELNSPGDLVHILFRPEAQGTVRTLSERLFFLVFYSIFGLHSPPFRIWAFLTQFVNIVLLVRIARRLTGSSAAGPIAAMLWTANAGLAVALGWSSAYNEIAFAFFVLLAFYLFLRHIDTGQQKYWIWQLLVFLLGFGALELNVMYPALAAGYALCCARAYFRKSLFLFIPSILFTAAHFIFVPAPTDPYYTMHVGASLGMLWTYWGFSIGALRSAPVDWRPLWLGLATVISISLGLALFAWKKLRDGTLLPIFLLGWFGLAILPVLPLSHHFTEYYVTVPSIGLALLGAWAMVEARGFTAAIALALAALYLTVSITDIHVTEKYNYARSRRVKYLVTGLESLPKAQANKKLLLAGIDNDLFWTSLYGDPFRLIGIRQVYIVPGSEKDIDPHPEWGGISRFVLGPTEAVLAVKSHQAVVLQLEGRRLLDVTNLYLPKLEQALDGKSFDWVDVVDPQYAGRLGPTWYPAETGFRWMPKTASVKIARPSKAGQVLKVKGYCPAAVVAGGPLEVSFRADGILIGEASPKNTGAFELQFRLPVELIGESMMEIEIEVSRTTQVAGDPRVFGLTFGTFTVE
jgi:dolichyl-phosphate-mannose-protein mannosyltransferase